MRALDRLGPDLLAAVGQLTRSDGTSLGAFFRHGKVPLVLVEATQVECGIVVLSYAPAPGASR